MEGHVMPDWFKASLREFFLCWRQPMTPELGRAYWSTLSDCDQADVLAAGLELRRSAGGEWPPSASTWHLTAQRLSRERRLKEAVHVERTWHSEHDACDDTGWLIRHCTATDRCGRLICARADDSHEHTYAVECPCRGTNRTYQRNRERDRTMKAAR